MNRTKARKHAFCIAFSMSFQQECTAETLISLYESAQEIGQDDYISEVITKMIQHKDEIDELIAENLNNWSINRVSRGCMAAMRLAVCEMKYINDIPTNVSINEAIELVKEFEEEKSGAFVNGVLSGIMNAL